MRKFFMTELLPIYDRALLPAPYGKSLPKPLLPLSPSALSPDLSRPSDTLSAREGKR